MNEPVRVSKAEASHASAQANVESSVQQDIGAENADAPSANAPEANVGHAPKTRGAACRKLASINEEVQKTHDDEVIDLFPKPFLPLFEDSPEPPVFYQIALKQDKKFFKGSNPYLGDRTAIAARF